MSKQRKKREKKLNLLKRDNYRCGIHLGGCGKKLTLEEISIDHIIPKNILKDNKEYIQVKKSYKAYTKESIGKGLFNLQPMCFKCNNEKKQGAFPPTNIIKRCSNKCCKFIYIETENRDKYGCKNYLVFTHYLLKEDKYYWSQKKGSSEIKSIFFTFPLMEGPVFACEDGTRREKEYILTKKPIFKRNEFKKKQIIFKKNELGGSVSELGIIRNNQRYSKEEQLESAKSLLLQMSQSNQKDSQSINEAHKKTREFKFSNYREALTNFSKTIPLNSNDPKNYSNRGMVNFALGKYKEALVDYNKAIQLNPNNTKFYSKRGLIKCHLGEYKEAIEDCNKSISLNPENSDAYSNRGAVQLKIGEHMRAIEDFNRALGLNPNHVLAYSNRGISKSNLGAHKEAIEDFNKVIELNPNNSDVYNNRGIEKCKLGKYEEAIEDFNKSIELNTNNIHAYNNRSLAQSNLGKHKDITENSCL